MHIPIFLNTSKQTATRQKLVTGTISWILFTSFLPVPGLRYNANSIVTRTIERWFPDVAVNCATAFSVESSRTRSHPPFEIPVPGREFPGPANCFKQEMTKND